MSILYYDGQLWKKGDRGQREQGHKPHNNTQERKKMQNNIDKGRISVIFSLVVLNTWSLKIF